MRSAITLMLSAFVLMATVSACAAAPERKSVLAAQRPQTEAECAVQGGNWTHVGMMQIALCLMPVTDAGKACTQRSDCQSECIAPPGTEDGVRVTGQCSADPDPFGCKLRVNDGVARLLCVD